MRWGTDAGAAELSVASPRPRLARKEGSAPALASEQPRGRGVRRRGGADDADNDAKIRQWQEQAAAAKADSSPLRPQQTPAAEETHIRGLY